MQEVNKVNKRIIIIVIIELKSNQVIYIYIYTLLSKSLETPRNGGLDNIGMNPF